MPKIQTVTARTIRFLQTEIWRLSKSDLSGPKALLLKPMRILLLTIQGFVRDNCALRASALTFYSLLSVVPVVAMAFGIAKGFGLDQRLERLLYLRLAGQEEIVHKIVGFARSLLENTKGGVIAGIGVAVLFWSAIKVMIHIEGTLNEIWKVRSRTFIRKFTDYLAIMLISPLLVIISSSVNVYITTQVTAITGKLALLRMASPFIFFVLKLLPYGIVWLLFILIYMVMPNTQVRFKSALIAGIIGGTVFQLGQGFYINAQVLLAKYNAIYGSFAVLPLFLIWLQLSWMIVLFGAQIAFAHQHVGHHAMVLEHHKTSAEFQKQNALRILHLIVGRFAAGDPPPTADEIATNLQLPYAMATQLLSHLTESQMVAVVSTASVNGQAFQPARDIQLISVAEVLEAWDKLGDEVLPLTTDAPTESIRRTLKALRQEMQQSSANCLVKDL